MSADVLAGMVVLIGFGVLIGLVLAWLFWGRR